MEPNLSDRRFDLILERLDRIADELAKTNQRLDEVRLQALAQQREAGAGADVRAERHPHLGERARDLELPCRPRVGEGDVDQLPRRVAERADPRAARPEPPERRVRVRAWTDPERRPIGGKARQQRPPVPECLVEYHGRRLTVVGHVQLDARPPRRVLEPRVPERARVSEDAVEVERKAGHEGRC